MASTFKPQGLRAILYVTLVLVLAGGAGVFYIGLGKVQKYAVEVNHTVIDAEASGTQVQKLQGLKGQLAQSESLITKANQIFATPSNYQTQALTDISRYAASAGLAISKTSFEGDATSPTMVVSLQAPVSFSKLIRFLDAIEGNIPKMQVSSIGLSHVNGGTGDSVAVDDIKIMIATR